MLAILRQEVGRLVLVTKDRLLRFGSELLFSLCRFFNVEVIVLNAGADVPREQQEELTRGSRGCLPIV